MIEIEAFLDLHTHTRYPDNNNFPSEDIEFAAKNGGFSEILAMPNSEMVIDSIENLNKAREIDKNLKITIHRAGALTKDLEGKELVNYKEFVENGVFIFSDDGKSLIDNNLADEAFKSVASLNSAIFQHCESNCHIKPGDIAPPNDNDSLIPIYEKEESEILLRDIELVAKYGTRYHAQHISSKKCVELIKEAKENNLPITSEATPHHILENNENLDLSNGLYKMYPPIRTEEDRIALIDGLLNNTIDVIATDHAPHPESTKIVDFKNAARGVVGLESAFPMIYSSEIFSIEEIKKFMVENPRKILSEIGYEVKIPETNIWQACNKEFKTKSQFNNSIFENKITKIEKVPENV